MSAYLVVGSIAYLEAFVHRHEGDLSKAYPNYAGSMDELILLDCPAKEFIGRMKDDLRDFPRIVVWRTDTIVKSAADFLLPLTDQFMKQGRILILSSPQFPDISASLFTRLIISEERSSSEEGDRPESQDEWIMNQLKKKRRFIQNVTSNPRKL